MRHLIGIRILCLAVAVVLFSTFGAVAQENATITGVVTDPSGAVVPSVTITLTNPATGQARTAASNTSGIYTFSNVGIGHFTLSAVASGFQTFTKTDIVVNVAQNLKEDIALTVGSEGQTVTVRADALQLQSETSELSTLISGQQVSQLATNGRNVTALAALGMGVSNNLPAFGGVNALDLRQRHQLQRHSREPQHLHAGWRRAQRSRLRRLFHVPCHPSTRSRSSRRSTATTVRITASAPAGRSSWSSNPAPATSTARPTTSTAMRTTTPTTISQARGQPRPIFRLNEPGFNIGGPLWIPHVYNDERKRTFFFVNEEWRRLIQGSSPTTVNTIAADNFPVAGQPFTYHVPSNGTAPIVPVTSDPAKLAIYGQNGLTPGQPFPQQHHSRRFARSRTRCLR